MTTPTGPVPHPPATAALSSLAPLTLVWRVGNAITRCYDVNWGGARVFHAGNPSHPARFSPFTPAGGAAHLPVLYGADDDDGALAETVFHDVPVRGAKSIPAMRLTRRVLIRLVPRRDLLLADLTSHGLSRLGVSRGELVESLPAHYQQTVLWAQALHAALPDIDGLSWVSRRRDTSRCVLLFGDRAVEGDLEVADTEVPRPLAFGPGYDLVLAAASRAGITITF